MTKGKTILLLSTIVLMAAVLIYLWYIETNCKQCIQPSHVKKVFNQTSLYKTISHPIETEQVRLLVTGDQGYEGVMQLEVAQLAEQLCQSKTPHGVILTGDNFYHAGLKSDDDPLWNERFLEIYDLPCLKELPFYALLGNHDYGGSVNAQIAKTQLDSKPRWILPSRSYEINFGKLVGVYLFDTNVMDHCGVSWLCEMSRLKQSMQQSEAKWIIAVGHHPVLSVGKHRNPMSLRNWLLSDVLCESRVHLYVSGHDHNLQHLNAVPEYFSCAIHQLISGAGGATLRDIHPNLKGKGLLFAKKAGGLALLAADSETLSLEIFETQAGLTPTYRYDIKP